MSRTKIAIGAALLVMAGLLSAWMVVHQPFARDPVELTRVPLSQDDPSITHVGQLEYRGGIDIPRMDQNIGGLSSLIWDGASGRLLAITDDARWVWITPEESDDRLTGLKGVTSGPLLGLNGEHLSGKELGDSESLTRSRKGGWLIGFERDHRIWHYPDLRARPKATGIDPHAVFGTLSDNNGIETLAGDEAGLFLCAERQVSDDLPFNCARRSADGTTQLIGLKAPPKIANLGGLPTDADVSGDGHTFVLFRSYSPVQGNGAAIVTIAADGKQRTIATMRPPLSVDNFEGLAIRAGGGRTFVYIVSDDNFSDAQRTLLMKFEIISG